MKGNQKKTLTASGNAYCDNLYACERVAGLRYKEIHHILILFYSTICVTQYTSRYTSTKNDSGLSVLMRLQSDEVSGLR